MYALSGVRDHRESLSIRYTYQHEVRENTRSGCNRIIRGRNERTIGAIEFKEQRLKLFATTAIMANAA